MEKLRLSSERGYFDHGWLRSYHSFSFSQYYDPQHISFRKLRVINEDFIAPHKGFGTHSHADMEIITYMIKGQLEHKDSMGNGSIIRQGDVQYMSAGSGVEHSEFNPSGEDSHLLQIWIYPDKKGLEPRYSQIHFSESEKHNNLKLIVSGKSQTNTIHIHQDVDIYAAKLDKGITINHKTSKDRYVWLQLISGELSLLDHKLKSGDAIALGEHNSISITALENNTEFLLFDLN